MTVAAETIAARLRDQIPNLDVRVGIEELVAGMSANCAAVLPVSEEALDGYASDNFRQDRQTVRQTIGVVCFSPTAEQRGATVGEMETLRGQIRRALLGWTPDGAITPVYFVRGGRPEIPDNNLPLTMWQDDFGMQTFFTNEEPQ